MIGPWLDGRRGEAPLFPLPGAVLFPGALLPLHIFEPRYRQMTADALEGTQLIAMAAFKPRNEAGGIGEPPVHETVGLGRIVAHEQLPDGRYYLVLVGLARCQIVDERPLNKLYRVVELEVCDDVIDLELPDELSQAGVLIERYQQLFPGSELNSVLKQVEAVHGQLSRVCDLIVPSLPLPTAMSQRLLAMLNVRLRAQVVASLLSESAVTEVRATTSIAPPPFSEN